MKKIIKNKSLFVTFAAKIGPKLPGPLGNSAAAGAMVITPLNHYSVDISEGY